MLGLGDARREALWILGSTVLVLLALGRLLRLVEYAVPALLAPFALAARRAPATAAGARSGSAPRSSSSRSASR